ncbi:MobA/MobL family protein [Dokdonella sp.]|uniref:MobA/MobL family protein n=1 Tax=Dokdonella sp. TaxID=2291710 RepID=UPI003783B0A8
MAIYYSRLSLVSRSRGHSVVAAAAYRAGTRLHDERTDQAHDYSKRKGVLSAAMQAPAGASWALDLASVWSRAERAEVRRNARTARELVVALPAELTEVQNERLAQDIAQYLVDRYGVAVLVAIHQPDAHGDDRNIHCHLLMSTRVAGPDGFGAKVRVLDDRTTGPIEAEAMRLRVAERINTALAAAGHAEQVDPRPLKKQAQDAAERGDFAGVVALTRTPTRHQGRAASAMARRGGASEIVVDNAAVRRDNVAVSAWGAGRAQVLRRVTQTRAARSVRASSLNRGDRLRPRNGLGPLNAFTRATGADAELLNAQAQAAHETARVERDASEQLLDLMARAANQHASAIQAYLELLNRSGASAATAPSASSSAMYSWEVPSRRSEKGFSGARAARTSLQHARSREEPTRGRFARAVRRADRGPEELVHPESLRPPKWKPLTRRQWAEYRRSQRAALRGADANDAQTRQVEVREADSGARAAHETVQAAQRAPVDAMHTSETAHARTAPNALMPTASLFTQLDDVQADLARAMDALVRGMSSPSYRPSMRRRPAPS